MIVPAGKAPVRISMLASEESPSAEAVRTTNEDGCTACRVASSPATVSLAACPGETVQRTSCRKRPSSPTARNVRVSPTNIVAFVGTTESAGASCADTTRPVLPMPHARSARTAAHVIFRIRLISLVFQRQATSSWETRKVTLGEPIFWPAPCSRISLTASGRVRKMKQPKASLLG